MSLFSMCKNMCGNTEAKNEIEVSKEDNKPIHIDPSIKNHESFKNENQELIELKIKENLMRKDYLENLKLGTENTESFSMMHILPSEENLKECNTLPTIISYRDKQTDTPKETLCNYSKIYDKINEINKVNCIVKNCNFEFLKRSSPKNGNDIQSLNNILMRVPKKEYVSFNEDIKKYQYKPVYKVGLMKIAGEFDNERNENKENINDINSPLKKDKKSILNNTFKLSTSNKFIPQSSVSVQFYGVNSNKQLRSYTVNRCHSFILKGIYQRVQNEVLSCELCEKNYINNIFNNCPIIISKCDFCGNTTNSRSLDFYVEKYKNEIIEYKKISLRSEIFKAKGNEEKFNDDKIIHLDKFNKSRKNTNSCSDFVITEDELENSQTRNSGKLKTVMNCKNLVNIVDGELKDGEKHSPISLLFRQKRKELFQNFEKRHSLDKSETKQKSSMNKLHSDSSLEESKLIKNISTLCKTRPNKKSPLLKRQSSHPSQNNIGKKKSNFPEHIQIDLNCGPINSAKSLHTSKILPITYSSDKSKYLKKVSDRLVYGTKEKISNDELKKLNLRLIKKFNTNRPSSIKNNDYNLRKEQLKDYTKKLTKSVVTKANVNNCQKNSCK